MRVIGNATIVLITLAVIAMVGYLLLYPRGAVDPDTQGQDIGAIPTTSPTPSPTPTPTTATPTPPPQLSLVGACDSIVPMLDRVEDVRFDYVNDPGDLDVGVVTAVTSDLQSIRDRAPVELATTIDPLLTAMNAFTVSLAGSKQPMLDLEAATASEDAIAEQCTT
jgi:hypothetical protein